MTRRERLERKIEKRREWAESAEKESDRRLNTANSMASHIPFGQPILVGHHSEKRDRGYRNRIASNYDKAFEASKRADHHRSKADGLGTQLDGTIFSDDEDAIERLQEKLAALEARRDAIKAVNAAWRKAKKPEHHDDDGWAKVAASVGLDLSAPLIVKGRRNQVHCWTKSPFAPYVLTNLGGNITRAKQRIKDVTARQIRTAEAEEAGGVRIAKREDVNWCVVTFSEKPDRSVINALKAADYRWSSGSWHGLLDKLPDGID